VRPPPEPSQDWPAYNGHPGGCVFAVAGIVALVVVAVLIVGWQTVAR
jgi:hypothetical protein